MSAVLKPKNTMEELIEYAIDTVAKVSGNVFNEQHHFIIETKIRKRMMDLNMVDIETYHNHLKNNNVSENDYFISELTTHYTFFFREFRHFEYLQINLSKIIKDVRDRGDNTIRIYSLACSRGQEAYSLAMFFDFHLKQMKITDIDFIIEGSDVDKASVKIASNGVYKFSDIKSIPMKYMSDHWQRGKGDIKEYVKVKDSLKRKCHFSQGNLLNLKNELKNKYDIIFCRNVFIYFEESQIKNICRDILDKLQPKGLFFTGVSESLTSMGLPVEVFGPSVYGHKVKEAEVIKNVDDVKKYEKAASVAHQPSFVELPSPLKVLCVDDSKIILSLMKKIFSANPAYEIVGTAENGQQAEEFIKHNDVDVMTLDLHMPVMDGISYLKKNFNESHPPVVIVSSVSREDAFHAMEGLKLGASDYVEKPSLEDFLIKGDEIATKLRVAALEKITGHSPNVFTDIDREFKNKTIDNPGDYFYTVYGQYSSKKKIEHIIKELSFEKSYPPTFLLLEGSYNVLESIIDDFQMNFKSINLKSFKPDDKAYAPNTIYIGDFKDSYESILNLNKGKKNVMAVLGNHSDTFSDLIEKCPPSELLLDDINVKISNLAQTKISKMASDIGPYTSFAYQLKYFLLKDE